MLVNAHVGIYPREQFASQALEISMTFGVSDNVAQRDDIADTISYDQVVDRIRTALGTHQFNLLETLGDFLVKLMFQEFNTPWVKIFIAKPGVLRDVRRVGVYIERSLNGEPLPRSDGFQVGAVRV